MGRSSGYCPKEGKKEPEKGARKLKQMRGGKVKVTKGNKRNTRSEGWFGVVLGFGNSWPGVQKVWGQSKCNQSDFQCLGKSMRVLLHD